MATVSDYYNWSDGSTTKGSPYGGGRGQDDKVLNIYREMMENAQRQANEQRQQGIKRLEGQETDALRQEYIRKSKAEQALPQQIAMSGGGGLSETSALGLNADYGQNRLGIQKERMNVQNQFESDLNNNLSANLSSLDNAYASRLAQIEQQRADERRRQEEAAWQREQWENQNNQWDKQFEYGKQQDALNRQPALSRSSSGGSSKNPFEISNLNQAFDMWNKGIMTPKVAGILDGAVGGNAFSSQLSTQPPRRQTTKKQQLELQLSQMTNSPLTADKALLQARDYSIQTLIQDMIDSGEITLQEAQELAQKYQAVG